MIWPFSKKPKKAELNDQRGMNEDWQIGDIAECIEDDWNEFCEHNPRVGDVLIVSGIGEGVITKSNNLVTALFFEGKPSNIGWHCLKFVKHKGVEEKIVVAAKRGARRKAPA